MIRLEHADCLEALKQLEVHSLDALITDPPAGISFMGKDWDKGSQFIERMSEIYKECLRVLKPGAHGLVWAIPRTSHWTATALEQAGFEIRDVIIHMFGSGFPKSLDVSKAIDKMLGAEREVVAVEKRPVLPKGRGNGRDSNNRPIEIGILGASESHNINITAPATEEAKRWQGWGTALKPASEHWILVRKPLGESTVAKNVLKHGTGGLNIDASRISLKDGEVTHGSGAVMRSGVPYSQEGRGFNSDNERKGVPNVTSTQGRFPANFVLSHNEDCKLVGTKEVKAAGGDIKAPETSTRFKNTHQQTGTQPEWKAYGTNGKETVEAWQCTEGCAVKMLDEQSGVLKSRGEYTKSLEEPETPKYVDGNVDFGKGQTNNRTNNYANEIGGASRFFYCAKASKRDRNEGLEGMPEKDATVRMNNSLERFEDGKSTGSRAIQSKNQNFHPTVKSTKLMEYLIKLITPPNGVILDPFMGSGSTGVAAKRLGFDFIGIEKEAEYFAIAEKRIKCPS